MCTFTKVHSIYIKTINMSNMGNKLDKFLGTENNEEVCDLNGVCYIKTKDGLIEKTLIEKKLVLEDGRELLREETPISNSNKRFLR